MMMTMMMVVSMVTMMMMHFLGSRSFFCLVFFIAFSPCSCPCDVAIVVSFLTTLSCSIYFLCYFPSRMFTHTHTHTHTHNSFQYIGHLAKGLASGDVSALSPLSYQTAIVALAYKTDINPNNIQAFASKAVSVYGQLASWQPQDWRALGQVVVGLGSGDLSVLGSDAFNDVLRVSGEFVVCGRIEDDDEEEEEEEENTHRHTDKQLEQIKTHHGGILATLVQVLKGHAPRRLVHAGKDTCCRRQQRGLRALNALSHLH